MDANKKVGTLKSSVKDIRTILLNKVFWTKGKGLTAGLVNFDTLLLSVKFITRVQGNYVEFQFNIPKTFTIFKLKIKVSTFQSIFARFQKINDNIVKQAKGNQAL